jgi:RimJ/RimL family protein N-acetyltransferase
VSPDRRESWLNWIVRLRQSNVAIGYVQTGVVASNADVAWVVGVEWQARGYASEAARVMVEWLKAQGMQALSALIHPRHAASAAVARRCGLTPTSEIVGGEVVWRLTFG